MGRDKRDIKTKKEGSAEVSECGRDKTRDNSVFGIRIEKLFIFEG